MKEIKDYTYSDIIQADEGKLEVINENLSNIDKMKEIKNFSFLDVEPEYEVKLGFIINELKRGADKYELNHMVLPIEVIKFIADNTTDYRTIESACIRLIVYANMDRIKNITLDMAKNKIFNNYFNRQIEKDESILEILENESPHDFLKGRLGRTPSKEEEKLLEYLLVDIKLIPSAVNLLIDYVLKTNNNKLDIELIKKFANCFHHSSLINTNETIKNDIDNVEELISMFEKEFQRKLSPAEIETVKKLLETYTYQEISYALKASAINGVFNLRYIIKVLEAYGKGKQKVDNEKDEKYDYNWLDEKEKEDMMKSILNNFNKELIVFGVRPDMGAKAVICKTAKDCLALGKKVLFYSFELPEEITVKRINADDNSNLLVKDKPLKELSDMKDTIESFKPNIVFIDYFQLMTRDIKSEDIHVLNTYVKQFDIPIIVLSQIGMNKYQDVDFTNVDLETFEQLSPELKPIIEVSDRFIVFYDNGNKQYLLKELKNSFGEISEFDIRDLLN